jgi:peptidoglycan hydrolase-like protein with peptidoglycan-binding domain
MDRSQDLHGVLSAAEKALQTGLNAANRARRFGGGTAAKASARPQDTPHDTPLKTDGVFGPKTHAALKASVARGGAASAHRARAFGTAKGMLDDIAARPAKRERPDSRVKTLQTSWNALRAASQEPKPRALKEDGLFGPKTESTAKALSPPLADNDTDNETAAKTFGFLS